MGVSSMSMSKWRSMTGMEIKKNDHLSDIDYYNTPKPC